MVGFAEGELASLWGLCVVVLYGLGYSVGISFAFEGDVLYLCMEYA